MLLEQEFGWTGILAEPGLTWHTTLHSNRTAKIVTDAVWGRTGERVRFLEANEAELSTFENFKEVDGHIRSGKEYDVSTISLIDLLTQNDAPEYIDFLSIDTEGSEFEILDAFDFSKYKFGLIWVEHNYTATRGMILDLLERNGYKRVLLEISEFDDWYVLAAFEFPR